MSVPGRIDTFETFRGVVYPSQCDAMGHMNVQNYTAAFDQAMWHLVLALGYAPSWVHERREGWADVRHTTTFKRELKAGSLFHVVSAVRSVGTTSLTTSHVLYHSESGTISAECEIVSVYFDLARRVGKPIPDGVRHAAGASAGLPNLDRGGPLSMA